MLRARVLHHHPIACAPDASMNEFTQGVAAPQQNPRRLPVRRARRYHASRIASISDLLDPP